MAQGLRKKLKFGLDIDDMDSIIDVYSLQLLKKGKIL